MILENILQRAIDDDARKLIQLIITQTNLLLCLVNDILDLKMLELGRFTVHSIAFSPA